MNCIDCLQLKSKWGVRCKPCATIFRQKQKPFGFLRGMKMRLGKRLIGESFERMRLKQLGKRMNEESIFWKGNNVGYRALHNWVERNLGKPNKCEQCNKDGLVGHQIHWANKSRKYKRIISDWVRLCASCHGQYDHS